MSVSINNVLYNKLTFKTIELRLLVIVKACEMLQLCDSANRKNTSFDTTMAGSNLFILHSHNIKCGTEACADDNFACPPAKVQKRDLSSLPCLTT